MATEQRFKRVQFHSFWPNYYPFPFDIVLCYNIFTVSFSKITAELIPYGVTATTSSPGPIRHHLRDLITRPRAVTMAAVSLNMWVSLSRNEKINRELFTVSRQEIVIYRRLINDISLNLWRNTLFFFNRYKVSLYLRRIKIPFGFGIWWRQIKAISWKVRV